jgi:hypothetical protein
VEAMNKKDETYDHVQAILRKREADKMRRAQKRALERGEAFIDEDGNLVYVTGFLLAGVKTKAL